MKRRAFTAYSLYATGHLWALQKAGPGKTSHVYKDAEIFPAIKAIIKRLLAIDERKILATSRFVEDLECDSLNTVEIVMECEDQFGIDISDKSGQRVKKVQDLVDVVKAELKKRQRLT